MPSLLATLSPADFGFDLNNREIASLILIGAAIGALLAWKDGRKHLKPVLTSFFAPKLSQLWGVMTAYTVASVALLSALNVWEWENLKTTLLWWASVGFASIWESQKLAEERDAFRRLVRDAVNITAVIVFIAEVKTFPLLGELAFLMTLIMLSLMLAVAQLKRDTAILVGPLSTILTILGLVVLWQGASGVLEEPDEFFAWNTLREFASPIVLSLLFIPFLYGVAVWITHDGIFTRARALGADAPNTAYARRKALLAFGMDVKATKRFARDLRAGAISERAEIDAVIRNIKRLKKREKDPPAVASSEGWSPYDAMGWLHAHGVHTDDWHASAFDDEWIASAYSVPVGERPLPDRISYYLVGTEVAATCLRLALDASPPNDAAESDAAFFGMARTLVARVSGEDRADALLERVFSTPRLNFVENDHRVSLEWRAIGENAAFGHQRNLRIVHPAHKGDAS